MGRTPRPHSRTMGPGALLALLALMVNVLCPPGFMVASRGPAPAIVICTGHGPVSLAGKAAPSDHRTGKAGHVAMCPFAGHGAAATAPFVAVPGGPAFAP